MKSIKFVLPLIICISSLFTFFPSTVSACSCMKIDTVEEALEKEDAVFEGKVLQISKYEGNGIAGDAVLFQVDTNWKGADTSQITVHTEWSSCMFNFSEGEEYLVYSRKMERGSLYTNICSRTNNVAPAQEDLTILANLQNLEQKSLPTEQVSMKESIPERDTTNHYTSALLMGFLILLVIVISIGIFLRGIRK